MITLSLIFHPSQSGIGAGKTQLMRCEFKYLQLNAVRQSRPNYTNILMVFKVHFGKFSDNLYYIYSIQIEVQWGVTVTAIRRATHHELYHEFRFESCYVRWHVGMVYWVGQDIQD